MDRYLPEASLTTIRLDGEDYVKAGDMPALLRQIASYWELNQLSGQEPFEPVSRLRTIAETCDFMLMAMREAVDNRHPDDRVVVDLPREVAARIARSAAACVGEDGAGPAGWDFIAALHKLDPVTGGSLYRIARYAIDQQDSGDGSTDCARHRIRDRKTHPGQDGDAPSLLIFETYDQAINWREGKAPRTDAEHLAMFPQTRPA